MAALVRVRRGVPIAGPGSLLPGDRVAPEDFQRAAATVASLQRANELLKDKVGALTGDLAAKDRELDQCRAEIARLQATVQAHKATIGEQVAEISKLKEKQASLVQQRKWLADQLKTVRTQVQQLTAERDRLAAELQRQTQLLEGERQTVQNMVVDQARQTADYRTAMEQLTGRYSKVADENNQLRDRIAKVNERYFTLTTAIQTDQTKTAQEKAALIAERDALQATRDQLIAQVQNVSDRSIAETSRLAALLAAKSQEYDQVLVELQSENVDWSRIYGKLKQEKAELAGQLASCETEIQRLSDQSDESKKRLARVVADYDTLTQLYDRLKTMHDAAQTKMSEMDRQYREAIDQRDREISDMQTKLSGAQASLASSAEHQQQHLTGIQRLSTEREKLLAQQARHIETMNAQRGDIDKFKAAASKSGQEVEELRARLNAAVAQNRKLAEQCKHFEGQERQYGATIARIGSEYQDAARRQLAESSRVCDALKAALINKEQEFAQLQAQLEASRVAAAAKEQELAQLQAQLAAAASAAAQSAQQLKSAQDETARLVAQRDKHVRIMDERQVAIDQYQAAATRSAEELQQLRSRLGQITSENRQLTSQLEQLQTTLSAKERQYSAAIGKNNSKNQGLLHAMQNKLDLSKREEERLNAVIAVKEQEYAQLQAELNRVHKELAFFNSAGYKADREGLVRQIGSLTAAREQADLSVQALIKQSDQLRAEQAALIIKHNELLQMKDQEIRDLNTTLQSKDNELQKQRGFLTSNVVTIKRLEGEIADLRASAAKLLAEQQQKDMTVRAQMQKLQDTYEQCLKSSSTDRRTLESHREHFKQLEKEKVAMQQQISELQRTLEQTQSANAAMMVSDASKEQHIRSLIDEKQRLTVNLKQVSDQLSVTLQSNERLTAQLNQKTVELEQCIAFNNILQSRLRSAASKLDEVKSYSEQIKTKLSSELTTGVQTTTQSTLDTISSAIGIVEKERQTVHNTPVLSILSAEDKERRVKAHDQLIALLSATESEIVKLNGLTSNTLKTLQKDSEVIEASRSQLSELLMRQ